MNDFEFAHCFRQEALLHGLDLGYDHGAFKQYWELDLNQGTIWTAKEYIAELIELAESMFPKHYGEQNAILQLVCMRKDLNNDRVYWNRPYYTNKREHPELWISIGEYLGE